MDDYLNEDDQWEWVKRWLKENGPWILGGVIIAVACIFGWRWWQDRKTAHAHEAGAIYTQMMTDLRSNDRVKAQASAARLRKDYADTAYADPAELVMARIEVQRNELDQAAARLKSVMERSKDEPLRKVVRLRLARVQLAQNKPDEALATLGSLKTGDKDGSFAAGHHEVRGDILLAKGDRSGARAAYREALKIADSAGLGSGGPGESQLQLKLNDLEN